MAEGQLALLVETNHLGDSKHSWPPPCTDTILTETCHACTIGRTAAEVAMNKPRPVHTEARWCRLEVEAEFVHRGHQGPHRATLGIKAPKRGRRNTVQAVAQGFYLKPRARDEENHKKN